MLKHTTMTEQPASTGAETRPGPQTAADARLRLRMDFTDPRMAVLTVSGELDGVTTPRLAELMWPRLLTELTTFVLDLGEVSFLGVDGLQLLARAHSYATQRGITLCLIGTTPSVKRALLAGGLDATLPCFADVQTAHAALAPGLDATAHIARQRTAAHR